MTTDATPPPIAAAPAPGPYRVVEMHGWLGLRILSAAGPYTRMVATVDPLEYGPGGRAEAHRTAELLAASWEMREHNRELREALRRILRWATRDDPQVEPRKGEFASDVLAARALLARVEGGSPCS